MEKIDKNNENRAEEIDVVENDLETSNTDLELAEIEEFQDNLEDIMLLEPEEKNEFMRKLKTGLQKVGNVSLMLGGGVVLASGLSVFGITAADVDWGAIGDMDATTKALPDSSAALNILSSFAITLGSIAAVRGADKLEIID